MVRFLKFVLEGEQESPPFQVFLLTHVPAYPRYTRERDRDRDRETGTDRQTDRDRQRQRDTDRQADRQTDRDRLSQFFLYTLNKYVEQHNLSGK